MNLARNCAVALWLRFLCAYVVSQSFFWLFLEGAVSPWPPVGHSIPEGPAAEMDAAVVPLGWPLRAAVSDLAQWSLTP